MKRPHVLCLFGTRPEAIKLAPVIRELRAQAVLGRVTVSVCVTAQHRQMLDQVLELFEIVPNHDLKVMEDNQTPTQVAAAVLARLEPILARERPHWVLVQGDTTTAAAGALAAFYARCKVAHVEAGLRTGDKWQPFPEEINRRVVTTIADAHFAPTERARDQLEREGVARDRILLTGNTVVDALLWAAARPTPAEVAALVQRLGLPNDDNGDSRKESPALVLVTAHRRENFGTPLEQICDALRLIADRFGDRVRIVYPVHLNPNVREPVHRLLGGVPNITLTPPLDYLPLVHLLKRASVVLTDSGGIQEEAPTFGVPVLVMREVTERPDGVALGLATVTGVCTEVIVAETASVLNRRGIATSVPRNPYGDGHASARIVAALLEDAS
jgi:UDP-N-acetylglucosamine 2-epimerase (non-hydrolysing)